MKIFTVSEQILRWLKGKGFVFGGILERNISGICSCKPSNVSRRLRELAEDGLIYKDFEKIGRTRVVKYKTK